MNVRVRGLDLEIDPSRGRVAIPKFGSILLVGGSGLKVNELETKCAQGLRAKGTISFQELAGKTEVFFELWP